MCLNGFYLFGNDCLSICPIGYVANQIKKICESIE